MSKQSESAKKAWAKIRSDPERLEERKQVARQVAAKRAETGWKPVGNKGKTWKVNNRTGTAHECTGPGCTSGRHTAGAKTRFQQGHGQTNPRSLANLREHNEQKKLWKNGTSYEGKFTYTLRKQVWERDKHRCQDCERDLGAGRRNGVVHHKDFDKGHNELENLVLLCRSCHIGRHSRGEHGRLN